MKIAITGNKYVRLSAAVLLTQHHEVVAFEISEDKVKNINAKKSQLADVEIEEFLIDRNLIICWSKEIVTIKGCK